MPNQQGTVVFGSRNLKQQEFLAAFDDPQFANVGYIGGRGCGKTTILAYCALRVMQRYPGIRIAICAHAYSKLRDSAKKTFMDMLAASGLRYAVSDRSETVLLKDYLSECIFRSFAQEEVFRGPTVAIVFMEEAREVTEEMAIVTSAAIRQPGYPHKFCIFTTPRGRRHWTTRFFIGGEWKGTKVVTATSMDNMMYTGADYIERLRNTHTGPMYQQEVLGRHDVELTGGVYSAFTRARNVIPLCEPDGQSIYGSMDFGLRHPTARLWMMFDPKDRLVVFDSYKRSGLPTTEHVDNLRRRKWTGHESVVWCDSAAAQSILDYNQMFHSLGMPDNLAPAKKQVNPFFDDAGKGLSWKLRMHSLLNSLFAQGRILICENCEDLIEEIEELEWVDAEEEFDASGTWKTERTRKVDDDLIDCLHYMLTMTPMEMSTSGDEPDKRGSPEVRKMFREMFDKAHARSEEMGWDEEYLEELNQSGHAFRRHP